VNTPDALLEVFAVQPDGSLVAQEPISVGLEPVTVIARTDGEAWVVNNLSDTVSIVDLALGVVTRTLYVGDEPTDVVFAAGRAFVTVSSRDAVKVYTLSNLDAAPSTVSLAGREVRALAVSNDGQKVYAVPLKSGNRTTILGVEHTFPGQGLGLDPARLAALNLRDIECDGPVPPYPPLPGGILRNPALNDPPDGVPRVGLIVAWNESAGQWQDEIGQDWSHCLRFSLSDHDLFVIDATSLAVTTVDRLGTSLFEVSAHPNGKIYVANTEARNFVRFEHALGVQGHVVDNRLSIVDPGNANAVTILDLNTWWTAAASRELASSVRTARHRTRSRSATVPRASRCSRARRRTTTGCTS
jgi:DNA-binding beta-propeller fold protein YncE